MPWGVVFPGAGPLPRHPSQIYETALEGPALFLLLWGLFRYTEARRRPGLLTGAFVLGYGTFRFLVEFVREPDRQLVRFAAETGLHMGQWLCVPMIAAGGGLILRGLLRSSVETRVPHILQESPVVRSEANQPSFLEKHRG